MAIVTYIPESKQSVSAMKAVVDYCLQDKKVADEDSGRRLVGGVNCNGENAFTEFMVTKNTYKKTGGVTFYHYVQSFSPSENVTAEQVQKIGLEFAEKAWPGHEVLVTTHCDAEHIHSHFVINSVNFENGYKLRQNPQSLIKLRALSDEICLAHGLSTLSRYEGGGSKVSSREYRAAVKGESWKFKLMSDIDSAMNKSGSKQEFISAMQRKGYEITWTDERKYITFICPNGKKCRDKTLHDEKYLKENMNYNSDNNTTKTEGSLVESLKKINAQGITELQKNALPVMVPIQEKDWDTMVSLLQSAVDFQPKIYELMETLLTVSKMDSMLDDWADSETKYFNQMVSNMADKLRTQQTAVENILLQMKNHEQQAGSHLEKIMKDTLEQGKELEKAIAKAQEKTDRRTWIIRTAISLGASVLAAALSTLLCALWLA